MCPIVPTLMWGFVRSNFCLAIAGVMLLISDGTPSGRHDEGGCLSSFLVMVILLCC